MYFFLQFLTLLRVLLPKEEVMQVTMNRFFLYCWFYEVTILSENGCKAMWLLLKRIKNRMKVNVSEVREFLVTTYQKLSSDSMSLWFPPNGIALSRDRWSDPNFTVVEPVVVLFCVENLINVTNLNLPFQMHEIYANNCVVL